LRRQSHAPPNLFSRSHIMIIHHYGVDR
jgi:hypothetical protein